MLDIKTRKTIDEARDILVGKIPAPNTQVEQITLALLYKFMDDMDQEAIEMGGKPKFFVGDYEKYSWKNIISNRIGSQERYNLYTEALEKFYTNKSLPQTFRDIFKNATVPYKDADVLTMFLRKIDTGLSYEDSEQLGDAYEYLLMILGSQGDLGQFRTPRHIIDFIVEVLDPKEGEHILDPACGTGGFLISSYKYILQQNTSENSAILGDKLNYDQKLRILKDITGYDIEPSMVRIAEMNLFLHGANDPDIREYDTLTYDEHWEEKFDVILANPPFMTPKGGINPHSKFEIQVKRSEVLFVDYIISHIRSKGKAGIIIPDSILHSTENAYEKLREKMINNGLYMIISLPAGIFKPYAKDVKTSILFFDKSIDKKHENILFIELKSDGFTLTDTRKPTKRNDIPKIKKIISYYKKMIFENNDIDSEIESDIQFYFLNKKKVKSNKSVLIASQYNKVRMQSSKYKMVKLGDLLKKQSLKVGNSKYVVWSVSNKFGFVNTEDYHNQVVASENIEKYKIVKNGFFAYNPSRINVGSIALNNTNEIGCVSPMYVIFSIKDLSVLKEEYLLLLLKSIYLKELIDNESYGAVRKQLRFEDLCDIEIPLPSLKEQDHIIERAKIVDLEIKDLNYQLREAEKKNETIIEELW